MPYATEHDLIKRWRGAPVDPGDEALVTALADASATIDTYLAKRFNVPVESPPRSLVNICVDLACYGLARDDTVNSEDLRKRYDDAMATLKDIAKGTIDLPGLTTDPEDNNSATPDGGAVVIAGPPRLFGRDKGW